MAHIRLGNRGDGRNPLIRDFVPLASLDDLVFGGWDPYLGQRARSGAHRGRARGTRPRADQRRAGRHRRHGRGVRPRVGQAPRRFRVKTAPTKMELAEALIADIERFQAENGCDRLVMVWCGSTEVYREPARCTRASRRSSRASRQPRRDQPEPDLRVRRAQEPRALRQRRAEPELRSPVHDRARRAQRRADQRQGLQDRPDADEDDPGARASRPHARPERLVLDQHPRQPRRRGARRPRELQVEGSVEARRARHHLPARGVPASSTATSPTSCASTTTRRAATTKRAGTTSTSSGGWATRCRSRSTSCAATRSSPRRSCSTSRCSSTSRRVPASRASRSG